MTALSLPDTLARLVAGDDLDEDTAARLLSEIMDGNATLPQVAGFLVALRCKGEATAEIVGLVRAMRSFARRVHVDGPVVDTCGTGGDRAGTFNVSTVAALVAAGAGATVAKHGNRAASSHCGSADLLEAWGVAIDLEPEEVEACIAEVGIGFCFAQVFHPAMRYVMPARRELGIRTVFNYLGPLTNPAGAQHQTIGVSDPVMAARVADVLARLGTAHALVFHGADGLDELSTTGPSTVWEIRDDAVVQQTFDPAELGLQRATVADLRGGDLATNRAIAESVLGGTAGPPRDIVLLGAGAALLAADRAASWSEAIAAAAAAIDSGAAASVLERWIAFSRRARPAGG